LAAVQGRTELMRFRAGDFFGETTLLEMQPRPFTARVLSDVVLYELSNQDLYKLYKEDVKAYVLILQNINRELCRRLRSAEERIVAAESGPGVR
jgi:CRP-like cAMP-binding protein